MSTPAGTRHGLTFWEWVTENEAQGMSEGAALLAAGLTFGTEGDNIEMGEDGLPVNPAELALMLAELDASS
jgi:hypothetical protein